MQIMLYGDCLNTICIMQIKFYGGYFNTLGILQMMSQSMGAINHNNDQQTVQESTIIL